MESLLLFHAGRDDLGLDPGLLSRLADRGVSVEAGAGEDLPDHRDRLATELMSAFRDTREEAFYSELYRLTGPSVLRWIRTVLARRSLGRHPGAPDPEEVLQETFINVFRYGSCFRTDRGAGFRAWVRAIGANACRRAIARRAKQHELPLMDGVQDYRDPGEGPAEAVERECTEIELQGARCIFLAHYARAWSALRPRDREALRLVEVEQRSYQQAAELLGVGESNIKMVIFRARQRLHRHMKANMVGMLGSVWANRPR
jgi:RNA polymerase sigma-70 factor (ECF subfamily)